ncbi:MAG: type IV secretion system DNA-binding domain-containing protein [Candidatus Woesebacteria bacterium]|nr:MAG: type IV secretion system DNA-binding domain-containing protein [Candidatus Woesebacteria bacterium]
MFIDQINFTGILLAAIGIAVLIFLLVALGYAIFIFFKHKNREESSIDSVLLQVALPRNNEAKIDVMEQLFSSLYTLKKGGWKQKFSIQPSISFEIVAKQEDIRFYVWCPKKIKDLVEKQINGAYSDAEILEIDEYNVFTKDGRVAYKSFQLGKSNFYPIKTFKDLPTDPMSAITSALAKMGPEEAAVIQVLISPAESDWQKEGGKFISDTKKQESDPEKAKYSTPAKTLEAVENKIAKPGFETSIRIVVVSLDEDSAKSHVTNIAGAFAQFAGDLNNLKSRKIWRKGSFMEDFLYRYQPMFNLFGNHSSILNSEELATIFHFPNRQITTPHIFWLNSKTAPAPAQIPTTGLYLGVSNYRGIKRPVFLGNEDRMRHVYIIGKTGTGKSEILKDMVIQDIKEGKGVCFMDPHGDAIEDILKMVPPERAEDVIYFNPSDTERPLGLNLLEARTEDEKHFAATAVINMMYKLFDPYKTGIVGPRFEHAVRNAMLTAMYEPGSTFVEIMRILTDAKFVQELLPKVQDPIIRRYWTDQIAQTSDFHKSEVLDYITSKFGRFVTNKLIRNIIGQSQSSFDLRKVMDEGKILLINLAKGSLGEENSNFLGLILVPRVLMAAMSRVDMPMKDRRDFYFYVDEFQNFATPDFAVILSEARKYRLGLCVANQFIGQVEEEVKNAVFGNVGTIVAFRVGVTDANYLAHEFAPVFGEDDLLNVERYHAFAKTIVNNEPVPPFSMDLTKDMSKQKAAESERIAEIIKEMSRLKYGRDEKLVEAEITRRAKL